MIVVRRNSREFRAVLKLLKHLSHHPAEAKQLKLYALKAPGHLESRVAIDPRQGTQKIAYELSFKSILAYLEDPSRKLYRARDKLLYFFKINPSDPLVEFPFEIPGKLRTELPALVRVKG